jgi:dTMP kinase
MTSVTAYGQRPNPYPGKLVIVEGIDGSGKSTQLSLLTQWLRSEGHLVTFSEWNSSPIVKATTSRGKKNQLLTPLTFSLIHATDFSDRVERDIVPALKAGAIVLADRYVYTAFARDVARGVDRRWVRELYSFAVKPDLAVYFRVPIDVALYRILSARPKLKWYEAGMDLGLSADPSELPAVPAPHPGAVRGLVPEYGLATMDATLPVECSSARCAIVRPHLRASRRRRRATRRRPEGGPREALRSVRTGSAGLELGDLSGWLIVVEDRTAWVAPREPARAPRATRYAVAETGLTRSDLASRGIRRAKQGNTLGSNAFNLFYATDFADRLEQQIVPALRAGFVMITDRYIYSLIARAIVRGAEPDWIKQVYSFALLPDAVFYLRIDPAHLVPRVLAQGPFDYGNPAWTCRWARTFTTRS